VIGYLRYQRGGIGEYSWTDLKSSSYIRFVGLTRCGDLSSLASGILNGL